MGTVTPTGVCGSPWFLWFTTGFHSLLLFWYIIKYIKYRLIIFTLIRSPSARICSERGGNSVPPLVFAARGGQVVPSRHPHPHCTPFPPHKQLLVVAVGGAVVVVVLRRCLSSCRHRHLSLSVIVVIVIVICRCCHCRVVVIPPAIHPTSSCS